MRVLLIEDQKQMRPIIRRMLQQMRFFTEIDEADGIETGWSKIPGAKDTAGLGLILCDVSLPADGIAFLKRCRSHSDYHFLPIILISSSSQGSLVTSALGEWGANDFIVKPFSYELLSQRITSILKRASSPEEHLYRQAEKLKMRGSIDDALKLIDRWEMENRLSRAKWHNLKGECLMDKGEGSMAAAQFEKAFTTSNIFIAAYKNYASTHERLGNLDKAIKALKQVETLSPTNKERTLTLGRLLLQSGQEEEGRAYLDALVKRSTGEEKEAVLKDIADIYLEGGLFKEAEDMFVVTLKVNPSDVETCNRLAIALRQQAKYGEAEQVYLQALKFHPSHAGLYHNLGVLCLIRKQMDKAVRCFKKALSIDPDLVEARTMLENVQEMAEQANADSRQTKKRSSK